MATHIGNVPASSTLYIPFETVNGTGLGVTITGLAVTDIEVYKNGSTTQRASDNGYALLDTDGIDFDGVTGLHGFSIDLSDNSDSGFYAAGAQYWVLLNAVTLSGVAITPLVATFRIVAAEAVAGKPKVDVDAFGGSAGTFAGGRPEVNASHWAGTATTLTSGLPDVNMKTITAGIIAAASFAANALDAVWSTATRVLTAGTNIALAKGTGLTGLNDLSAAAVNAEVDTAIADAELATAANLATVDTVVDAIKLTTDKLDDTVEDDAGTFRFTANALEQAPSGGGTAPTVAEIADEVQTRTIAAVTTVNGFAANSVTAAALATDAVTEIQGGLATASALSTVSGKIDTIADFLDTEVAAILADTNELQTDWANGGRLDIVLDARASQTSVDDLPTNAELTTALAGADDAILAVLGNPAGASLSADVAAVKADTGAVKTKTDSLTFTVAGAVDANVTAVNEVEVIGTGVTGDEWSPA